MAARDITPPVGTTLVGYKPRVSASVAHPLRAEALSCRDADGAWILVTADVLGFRGPWSREVRERIGARTGVAAEAVVLAAVHTHSGPPTTLCGGKDLSGTDRRYMESLADALVELAAESVDRAAEGSFRTAMTEAPRLGSNRRIAGADGVWINEWRDPEGRHPGYFDPSLLIVSVQRPAGARDGLLVNYGCHPVVLGPDSLAVSADYVGYMKDALERGGLARTALFALAGAGNVNPRDCILTDSGAPRAMGEELARIAAEAVPRLTEAGGAGVASARLPWDIVRTRDAYKPAGGGVKRTGETIRTEVAALRAGNLVFLGVPGELFSEYAAVFRRLEPGRRLVVVSLADDYIGYLPTDEAQRQGAYETKMAPASDLEAALTAKAREALGRVLGGA